MGLEMVLNDLSLLPFAENEWVARQRMERFVGTLQAATKLGAEHILRTDNDLNIMELTPGYSIAHWRNDPDVDRETRRYFRSLATKAPYLQDVNDSQTLDTYYSSDFFHGEKQAAGLDMAFLLDALAISFHSHAAWEMSSLQLSLTQLQEDDILGKAIVSVKHACLRDHILEHRAWMKKRTEVNIESGADLCACCATLYPNMQFCASAIA